MSKDGSDASAQVSHTATYAHSCGMMVPAIVAQVSRAANPAPAMPPPMARTVMYSPTEMPVDGVLARSVSTTAIALAVRPIPALHPAGHEPAVKHDRGAGAEAGVLR